MERNINGPDWELGDDKQAALWLRIEVSEWRKITDRLCMEPDVRISRQTFYWGWRQVVGVTMIGADISTSSEKSEQKRE